jgi:hypothetical protein
MFMDPETKEVLAPEQRNIVAVSGHSAPSELVNSAEGPGSINISSLRDCGKHEQRCW